jgi:hypothetical protein
MRVPAFCFILFLLCGCSKDVFQSQRQLTKNVLQFEKAEFSVVLGSDFRNPYDQREIALNMILKSPSGDSLFLPCYFERRDGEMSLWRARFTPRESGTYSYHFECIKDGTKTSSRVQTFVATGSHEDGFLHINDLWTLRFDSGRPFRGIGENVGWEPRSFSNQKWTYDYLLPRLASSGANFFRAWMAPNNFPLEWRTVKNTKRYFDTEEYFNPGGTRRLDEVVDMLDSLGLYMMLAFDSHNTLIEGNQWEIHNYNKTNGGPAAVPEEFFTLRESRERYKNRLRYIVARWGYSPHIAAWEFFNEIDNAAFGDGDSVLISPKAIASWHREMAAYLKSIDPYDHIVTTSVSHREINGMYAIEEFDINQMHIYRRTHQIPKGIQKFTQRYGKPFVWGEFAYEWDWNKDFAVITEEMDFDFKRGLWYGLFSPTPILPMSWWWEFFDERGMTPYFRNVREIGDRMLSAGNGSFQSVEVKTQGVESYAVKCGDTYFAYLLNSGESARKTNVLIGANAQDASFSLELFEPADGQYKSHPDFLEDGQGIKIEDITLQPGAELIVILTEE